jgi:ATP-binding cassette subfamily G (WHITE) protein 2 (PDR)
MSLVGNFTSNYDATTDRAGATASRGHGRRGSNALPGRPTTSSTTSQQQSPTLGLHRTKSVYSEKRRRSTAASRPRDDTIDFEKPAELGKEEEEAIDDSTSDDEDRRREQEVHAIARKLTQHSTYSESELNPFDTSKDSKLNPHSERFNAKAWTKAMLDTHLRDPKSYPLRTAGIAFRHLNVFGFGVSTD